MTGSSQTSLGWSERTERVLAYPLLWVSGLILFVLERKNKNVQWHAKQSMAVFGPLCLVWWLFGLLGSILGHIWIIGGLFAFVFSLLSTIFGWVILILAIFLMIMAWFKPDYRLPYISDWLRY